MKLTLDFIVDGTRYLRRDDGKMWCEPRKLYTKTDEVTAAEMLEAVTKRLDVIEEEKKQLLSSLVHIA